MNSYTTLERVTEKILDANSSLQKIKELVDLELITISIRDLSDPQKVTNFLNTLTNLENEYPAFIQAHPVYFLLKTASFQDAMPLHDTDLLDAIQLITLVIKTFKDLNLVSPGVTPNLLSNTNIIAQLSQFISQLKNLKLNLSINVTPPSIIGTFKFIEELTFSFYLAHWHIFPQLSLPPLNPQNQSILEQWLLISYLVTFNIPHNLPKVPNIKPLSKTLLTNNADLFIPISVVTETSLTLPLAKERASEIFLTVNESITNIKNAPILGFRDVDLNTLSIEYLFLYDFIFEGLCNNKVYSCTRPVIEGFLKKCLKFLTNLTNFIQTTSSNKNSLSLSEIESIRLKFTSCGLTQNSCNAFRTMLNISQFNSSISWKNFTTVFQLLDQVTLFAKYFFDCLYKCSPTSISFRATREIIHSAYVEQSSFSSWHANNSMEQTPNWPIPPLLKIFVPKPPEKELTVIFKTMKSNLMRSLFGISVRRNWGLNKIYQMAKNNVDVKSKDISQKTANKKQVQKFCDSLEVGDTEYSLEIVQSQYFAPEFIKTKIIPIMQTILSNNVSKHRILHKMRWLIIFAFDDALGLYQIRRPLSLAYFQLTDIYSQNMTNVSMSNLLDNFQEVNTIIKELVPDAPQLPINFLSHIYQLIYSPIALTQIEAANYFLREADPVLDGLWHMVRVSFILCHTKYNYVSTGKFLELPVADGAGVLKIQLDVFMETIKIIEHSVHEALVILAQMSQDLHKSYVTCLAILEKNQSLINHPLEINVSEPNFEKIRETLLECFKKYRDVLSLVSSSCCYSLTKHFSFLFEPDLIPEITIQKILNFSEDTDNPNMFIDSIQQPLDTSQVEPPTTSWPELTQFDVNTLKEVYHMFPSPDTPSQITPSIKLYYTDTVNVPKITLDWDKFSHSDYIPQEDQQFNFSHITTKSLEQTITGTF